MPSFRLSLLLASAALSTAGVVTAAEVPLAAVVDRYEADAEGRRPALGRNVLEKPLTIAGHVFREGVGVEVNSTLAMTVEGAKRFVASAGVDDATAAGAAVAFSVRSDGRVLWAKAIRAGESAVPIDVDLSGVKILCLVAEDVGNAATHAAADWVEARIITDGAKPAGAPTPAIVREEQYILTPTAPATPRINGARVFGVRPGNPFLFTVPATGERPMTFAAENLPAGLSLEATTGHITGTLRTGGSFKVTLRATNARGTDAKPLRIECGEELALTPPMGWNSWNCWGEDVDQDKVLRSARAMAQSGLVDHGWTYINIDDTWQGQRPGPTHALQANEKFPDLRKLCAAIHALGLKPGIYSTPWVTSYAKFPGGSAEHADGTWTKWNGGKTDFSGQVLPFAIGPYRFVEVDAKQWAAWGFDYLKYDWGPNELPETEAMAKALRASGRDLVFSLSNTAPFQNAAGLAKLANAWRTTGDIRDTWVSITALGQAQEKWRSFAHPGHWNDPDMLVVGKVGGPWRHGLEPTRLTPSEQYTHITLWSLLSAPLLIGCPLDDSDAFTLSLLSNDEVLAIDQDELGRQAAQAVVDGRKQIWVKELADGSRAIGLINFASDAQDIGFTWQQLGLPAPARVRDLWRQTDLPVEARAFTANVRRHGAMLLRVWPAAR